jgi:molybdate transport system substrate-binding protein
MRKKIIFLVLIIASGLYGSNLKVAAGAGYKKPLMEVIAQFEQENEKIDAMFGNMKQVTAQAKMTDIALIVGDKSFLSQKSGLDFSEFILLGNGKVVVAYPKGVTLTSIEQLGETSIGKIAMPQPKKAIYGIAGEEFLRNAKLHERVKDKLYIVATVPQSLSYVLTNEVDAAIVNLTATLANADKIGGYLQVPEQYYSPIEIVAGKLPACDTQKCQNFVDFLSSQTAKAIFTKYGL